MINKKFIIILILYTSLLGAGISMDRPYISPTEALIQRKGWKTIEKALIKLKIPQEFIPFFYSISETENWGHVGYHGANHSYRIYQDIIRMTIEEIVGIEIRENFQFLRIPGDPDLNLNSIDEFVEYWRKSNVDNLDPMRSKQLLSLNFSIFSHYKSTHNSSALLFATNKLVDNMSYIELLKPFYEQLGISPSKVDDLFAIADKNLRGHKGLLLQIFENSHLSDPNREAYNFTDMECYAAKAKGYRYGSSLVSKQYQKLMSEKYAKSKIDVAPQLRLLMNNRYTLNPFSNLIVKRWDLLDPESVELYEAEMREAIKGLVYSQEKVNTYKNLLLKEWF